MTITEQIHKEFDEAQEILLAEAKRILEKADNSTIKKIESNNSLLNSLGFKKVPSLQKSKEFFSKVNMSKQDLELVQDYKATYPFLRFLKISQLEEICEKYNLIHAGVGHYIKEVPTKNLEEIANAPSLERRHSINRHHLSTIKLKGLSSYEGVKALGHPDGVFTQAEIYELMQRYYGRSVDWADRANHYLWLHVVLEGLAREGKFSKEDAGNRKFYEYTQVEITEVEPGLHIAAPKSHFDLTEISKTGKFSFGFTKIVKVEPPDPVVFRYVKGGVQVLSKWGEEGNDPLLQVDITN